MKDIQTVVDFAVHVSEASHNKPVLVDFWAPWCGPCSMIAPALIELDKQYADRVDIVKVNVDADEGISANMGVRGIPMLMIFHRGRVIASKLGAIRAVTLSSWIDEVLAEIKRVDASAAGDTQQ